MFYQIIAEHYVTGNVRTFDDSTRLKKYLCKNKKRFSSCPPISYKMMQHKQPEAEAGLKIKNYMISHLISNFLSVCDPVLLGYQGDATVPPHVCEARDIQLPSWYHQAAHHMYWYIFTSLTKYVYVCSHLSIDDFERWSNTFSYESNTLALFIKWIFWAVYIFPFFPQMFPACRRDILLLIRMWDI